MLHRIIFIIRQVAWLVIRLHVNVTHRSDAVVIQSNELLSVNRRNLQRLLIATEDQIVDCRNIQMSHNTKQET